MKKIKTKKTVIIRLVTVLLSALFIVILLTSFCYLVYFVRISYKNNIFRYTDNAEHYNIEISDTIDSLNRQIQWLSTDAGELKNWENSNPYEQMLYLKRLKRELTNFSRLTDGMDGLAIQKQNSDIVIEAHSIDDQIFYDLLEQVNGYQLAVPQALNLILVETADEPGYILISSPVKTYDESTLRENIVANIYGFYRIERLLDREVPEGTCLLCRKINQNFHILTQQGEAINAENVIPYFEGTDGRIKIGGQSFFAYANKLSDGNFYFLYLVPMEKVLMNVGKVIFYGALIVMMIFAFVLYCGVRLSNTVRKPLRTALSEMDRVRSGEYDYRLKKSGVFEFDQIADSMNGVLNELDRKNEKMMEDQKKLYEMELVSRTAQLQALQSQINPHFLYNTLECVNAIARYHKIDEITRITEGMIYIFRYNASFNHMGTVQSEIDCARHYAEIIDIRYVGLYHFNFFIDEKAGQYEMPKMILQPLIENSIVHGMIEGDKEATVTVTAKLTEQGVQISIFDDGAGIKEDKIRSLEYDLENGIGTEHKPGRIGLFNVHSRISSRYGKPYGLHIKSEYGKYTEIVITVPAQQGQQTTLNKETARDIT